jgi:hypothetical protein
MRPSERRLLVCLLVLFVCLLCGHNLAKDTPAAPKKGVTPGPYGQEEITTRKNGSESLSWVAGLAQIIDMREGL